MDSLEDLDSETIERLGKQGGFLLATYHAELDKDRPAVPRNLHAVT